MPRIFFSFPLMAFSVFLVSINLVQARSFNNDFETGDLTDWKMDDTKNNAFEFQPTWEITPQHGIVANLRNIKGIGGSAPMKNTRGRSKGKS